MNIDDVISRLRRRRLSISTLDENIYSLVAMEVAAKQLRPGIYAKAYAESRGDSAKTMAAYINYRFQQIKEEVLRAVDDAKNSSTIRSVQCQPAEDDTPRSTWQQIDEEEQRIREHEERIGRRRD